jgi:hypothetical protein
LLVFYYIWIGDAKEKTSMLWLSLGFQSDATLFYFLMLFKMMTALHERLAHYHLSFHLKPISSRRAILS